MNDEYSRGYQLGQQHGQHPRHKKRPFKLAMKAFSRLSTIFLDSHSKQLMQGYEEGFKDAIRVVNVQPTASSSPISKTPPSTSASTMKNAFAFQAELQNNLKGWLHRLTEHLDSVAKQYVQKVEQLHAEGMMDETYQDYIRDYLDPTRERISRLIQHIEAQDIPRIEQEMRFLEDAAAGGRR
jgi:hypothetical protein